VREGALPLAAGGFERDRFEFRGDGGAVRDRLEFRGDGTVRYAADVHSPVSTLSRAGPVNSVENANFV